jgi:hypothetical protein
MESVKVPRIVGIGRYRQRVEDVGKCRVYSVSFDFNDEDETVAWSC